MIKKFAKVSPCCICGGIPTYEVVYDADGASRVERYCDPCSERVFSRSAVFIVLHTKHNFKRKVLQRDYNQNYHLIRHDYSLSYRDKHTRIL